MHGSQLVPRGGAALRVARDAELARRDLDAQVGRARVVEEHDLDAFAIVAGDAAVGALRAGHRGRRGW